MAITTLAISSDEEKLSYAFFEGEKVKDYGRIERKEVSTMHSILTDFA
jgi:hypothetical protein